ncbi:TonB-dependent receptor [Prosthecobacter vanneervenii]|uniref:Catecholate siderophore receptor n=1 Tax=Prosthecobacter vanneervenii TaxID=48466 RepID=A0A7W7YG56_9BACT|nr:TonB-dependent siderophore receptor [Prosthecobacter vanneervenii]MBB5035581.1 catecholate siderophore receptor [Prosthecobacter vanneervenii]
MQNTLAPSFSSRVLKSGAEALSFTSLLCAAGNLDAQTAATKPAPKTEDVPMEMPEVVIEASGSVYNPQRLQSPKYTEPLRDIPQTITVIPKAVIEDRGAFSLRDVLKNTPGISMQAGEGGAVSGDNLSIRGFSARSDIYLDGVRDYANYNRDPFNTEQVEITKGPSSSTVGRGSTGGSINTVSKMANLTDSASGTVSAGTSNLYRGTLDVNQTLSEHTAFRLNGMYHTADTPGRDDVSMERYGIAASLGAGLGTDTRFMLNYQRLEESNIPDYGLPWIPSNGTFSGSGTVLAGYQNQAPPGVSFNTFYGLPGVDYEKIQTDHYTAIFEHDFTKDVRLRNVTRYSRSHRDSVSTAPRLRDTSAAVGNQYTTVLNRQLQRRQQFTEMFGNQTNLVADFATGPIKHALVTGMEFYLEHQQNANVAGIATLTDLYNPGLILPPSAVPPANAQDITSKYPGLPAPTEAYLYTVSAYVFDTMKIGRHWEISTGLRYDHMYATVSLPGNAPGYSNADDLFSWKAALIYKPVKQGSFYFGYGTSFNPTIDGASGAGLGLAASNTNVSTVGLNPEHTGTYELGTKWDVLEERLSLTAALFRTEKTNARTTDASGITTLAGNQIVQGIEFSATGNITKNWQVFGGYAYMKSETKASTNAGDVGQSLSNAPNQTFNLWTTYNVTEKFQAGFGAQYMGIRTSSNGSTATSGIRVAPCYWTLDAMLNYKLSEKLSLRLNIYNLADERYVGSVGGGQFVPGPGRSAALTASFKF